MSQIADYNVANASGAAVRSDINNIFLAVASANSGTSEPSTMYPFMIWVDTTNDLVKLRNGANDAWLTLPYSMTASNTVDINGGTVDGTTIGSSSASTIVGTTVVANTSLNIASDGATVTGIKDEDDMSSNSAVKLATQQSIKAYVDSQVDTVDTLGEVLAIGNTTGGTNIAVSANDDITFTNSSQALFGTTPDLKIFHNGTDSYVQDSGTGSLMLAASAVFVTNADTSENMIKAVSDGAVELYHNGNLRLITNDSGAELTGATSAYFDLDSTTNSNAGLRLYENNTFKWQLYNDGDASDAFKIDYATGTAVIVDQSGNVSIGNSSPSADTGVARFLQIGSSSDAHSGLVLEDNSGQWEFQNNGTLSFFYDGSEKMALTTAGNVGIGDTSPAGRLTVKAADNTYAGGLRIEGTDETTALGITHINGDNFFSGNATDDHITLKDDGKVGIGTTSPATLMNIKGATAGSGKLLIESGTLTNNNQAALFMAASNVNGHSGNVSIECNHPNNQQSDLVIRTGATDSTSYGTERFRITTDGNVLVGTSATGYPDGKLHAWTNTADQYAASFRHDGNATTSLGIAIICGTDDASGTNTAINILMGNGNGIGSVTFSGSTTSYNTSSDGRLKDITGEAKGLEIINALNPVAFTWKSSGVKAEGLIAQEVEKLVDHAVCKTKENEYLQMDYSKLVTPLIKAVQELSAEVEQLKQQAHEKCEN